MKIALVKQDVYQDLYVHDRNALSEEILFSSIMRVGPIGLIYELGADFYIIKEASEFEECRAWEKVLPLPPEHFRDLKRKHVLDTKLEMAAFIQPGSPFSHKNYSVDYSKVDWGYYDIVISINFSIPTHEIIKHQNTLWCYMIGEANMFQDKLYFGYDVSLNQMTRGIISNDSPIVDFPYTFVKGDTLRRLIKSISYNSIQKEGIFIEINSVEERPVLCAPKLNFLEKAGYKLKYHKQNIKENLLQVYGSKYFVKFGGRVIRGNSVIESISLGTVVLMNPNELIHSQLLPKDSWIFSEDELIEKIRFLDNNPTAYNKLLRQQQTLVDHFAFNCPYQSLLNLRQAKLRANAKINTRDLEPIRLKYSERTTRLQKILKKIINKF